MNDIADFLKEEGNYPCLMNNNLSYYVEHVKQSLNAPIESE